MLTSTRILFAFAALITAVTGAPSATAAQTVDDIVSVEVIDGGKTERGTYLAAFRLTLAEGWKTYWRAPGDAGIPPSFSWKGSRNIGEMAITWPTPKVFDQNGMRSIGYTNQLVLPMEVTPAEAGRAIRIRGRLDMGVCSDVCVPSTVRFDHDLDPDAGRNPAIAAALAQRPYSASEAGVRSAICHIRPTDGGLRLEAHIRMPHSGGREEAVIEPGNPEVWASEPEVVRRGDLLIAASDLVHVDKAAYALDRSKVRITVLGADHAVDIQGCVGG